MKSVSISGSLRANVGTKDAKALRNQGQIPCVLYGGKEQVHFSAAENEFRHLIYTPEVKLAELNIGGKTYRAAVKEAQFHPVSDKLLHVDFLEISDDKPVTIEVPLKIEGNSPGVKAGGKLVSKFRKLKIRTLAANLPEFITINIDSLEIGQNIRVRDIKLEGITLLNAPEAAVVGVITTRNVAANPAEGKK